MVHIAWIESQSAVATVLEIRYKIHMVLSTEAQWYHNNIMLTLLSGEMIC